MVLLLLLSLSLSLSIPLTSFDSIGISLLVRLRRECFAKPSTHAPTHPPVPHGDDDDDDGKGKGGKGCVLYSCGCGEIAAMFCD